MTYGRAWGEEAEVRAICCNHGEDAEELGPEGRGLRSTGVEVQDACAMMAVLTVGLPGGDQMRWRGSAYPLDEAVDGSIQRAAVKEAGRA